MLSNGKIFYSSKKPNREGKNLTTKLTEDNQGYWDRIKCSKSWVNRAQELELEGIQASQVNDAQELFIMYWIAFNALYGRVNETAHGRYLRPGDDDARWFIRRICDLDAGTGFIKSALTNLHKEAKALMKSRFLYEIYWRGDYGTNVKQSLGAEAKSVEDALNAGDVHPYVTTLLWGRIRMLRNQIFHGCSTNRDSLNKDDLIPALQVLRVVIPLFIEIMEIRLDKESDWPRIPFPRLGSPQHPKARDRQQ